jgi:CHASE1-domain containing sensor protein
MTEQPLSSTNKHSLPGNRLSWRLWFSRHNWLTWLGLCFVLPVMMYYWQYYNKHIHQQQQTIFQQHTDNIEFELQQRLLHIELLLRANAAYVTSSEYVSQPEWQHYAKTLNLSKMYPGVQALGIVSYRSHAELPLLFRHVNSELQLAAKAGQLSVTDVVLRPAGDRKHYAVVSHIQPMTPQNQHVLGFDILSDPMRLQTAMRAASLNRPAITAKVLLQQDDATSDQPGLVLMFPFYQPDVELLSAEQKLAALRGFVYAAFRVRDVLPNSWLDPDVPMLDFIWSSGTEPTTNQLLFARQSPASLVPVQQRRNLEWYGQPFVLQIKNNLLFEQHWLPFAKNELFLLGSAGLVLLFLLLSYLNLRRYQTQCSAELLNQQLSQQRQLLLQDEQRQSLALKASQLAWFEFDLRSGGAFYSDNWWRMFDFASAQPNPEPQQLFDLVHPSTLALFRQDLQRLLANGPDLDQHQYRFVSKQGRQLYCLMHFYVVRAAEGDAIRLCCTMQDVTLPQHLAQSRKQLCGLCQWEVNLAWQLSRQLSLPLNDLSAESGTVILSSLPGVAAFQQQHCHWLLEFYCQQLGDSGAEPDQVISTSTIQYDSQHHSPQNAKQAQRALLPMLSEMIYCYQHLASANRLQLLWQPLKFSEHAQVDSHRFWQLGCGVLQLACTIAAAGSSLSVELLPFQTKLTLRLQLQLDAATSLQLHQDMLVLADNKLTATTFVQQRLQAAQFWAAQLGAELTLQQEQQELILLLLLNATDHSQF